MNMKKIISLCTLVLKLQIVWVLNCVAGQAIELQTGQYLSEKYIEILLRTKSPKAADSAETAEGTIAMVSKGKKTEDKYIIAAGTFSDGYGAIHITPEGKLNKKTSTNTSFPEIPLKIMSNKKFVLTTPQPMSAKITFTFVGNPYDWAAAKLFAGKYIDEKGKIYNFKENGSVIFQDKEYKYSVALDFSEPPIVDCLSVGAKNFHFKIKGDKLVLYQMSSDLETIAKTPSFVLTKEKTP